MQKLRTVRGVHDLLPYELHKHNIVVNAGLEISDKYNYSQIETQILNFLKFLQSRLESQVILLQKKIISSKIEVKMNLC